MILIKKRLLFIVGLLTSLSFNSFSYAAEVEKQSMFDWLMHPGSFSTLVRLFSETNMEAQINKYLERRTIFAPTDSAFNQFGRHGLLEGSDHIENKKKFTNFLVIPNELSEKEVTENNATFPTIAGPRISTKQLGKILYSLKVANGTIYVIDKVPVNPDLKDIFHLEKK